MREYLFISLVLAALCFVSFVFHRDASCAGKEAKSLRFVTLISLALFLWPIGILIARPLLSRSIRRDKWNSCGMLSQLCDYVMPYVWVSLPQLKKNSQCDGVGLWLRSVVKPYNSIGLTLQAGRLHLFSVGFTLPSRYIIGLPKMDIEPELNKNGFYIYWRFNWKMGAPAKGQYGSFSTYAKREATK